MFTLRVRLVLVNLAVFLITLIVLASVLTNQILSHLYEQLDQSLALIADEAVDHFLTDDEIPHLTDIDGGLNNDAETTGFVRLLDNQGNIVEGAGDFRIVQITPQMLLLDEQGIAVNQRSDKGILLRVYTRPIYAFSAQSGSDSLGFNLGYVQVAVEPEEVIEIIDQIRRSLLIGVPLALLFAGLAGLLLARKALEPLTVMTCSASEISADSLTERRLPVPKDQDEVQSLALAFNAMLDRLTATFTRQRRFTADASHELRTPVTAILGQAELALSRPRTLTAYQEALRRIQSEAERMQRLIGRMLVLARAESGQQAMNFTATDVSTLLHTLIETVAPTVAPTVEAKDVRLTVHAPPTVTIITDADSLTQILLNLLENAIAYTDRGIIDVTLTQQPDAISIQVSDSGPGIDPDDLKAIFDPFYRADPSRQRRQGNVGLGLALANELTRLLGGHITAANHPAGGAVFTVRLPLHPSSPVAPSALPGSTCS